MGDKLDPEDKEKTLYVAQIRWLDEKLQRCQLTCDELKKQKQDFVSLCRALQQETQDITEYLQHSVAARDQEAEELLEELEKLQQVAERDTEALKLLHTEQLQEAQEQVDELKTMMVGQVAELKEQQEQKEQLMELLQQQPSAESLETQLLHQQKQHEAAVLRAETEAMQEKRRLRDEIQSTGTDSMSRDTELSAQEQQAQNGEQLQLQRIQVLLTETMTLWEEKKELQDAASALSYETNQTRRSRSAADGDLLNSRREVEELTRTLQQLEEEQEDCNVTETRLQEEEQSLRRVFDSWSDECNQKTAEAAQARAELQSETSRTRQLQDNLQEAAILLRRSLTGPGARERLVQDALKILETNVPEGTAEESRGGQNPQSPVHKPDRAETQDVSTDPLARYRLPRPTWKLKPVQSSSQLPRVRKVCRQETPGLFLSRMMERQDPPPAADRLNPDLNEDSELQRPSSVLSVPRVSPGQQHGETESRSVKKR